MKIDNVEMYRKNNSSLLLLCPFSGEEVIAFNIAGSMSTTLNKIAHAFILKGIDVDTVRKTYDYLHNYDFDKIDKHIIKELFDFGDRHL